MRIISVFTAVFAIVFLGLSQSLMAAVSYSCQVLNPLANPSQALSKIILKSANDEGKSEVLMLTQQKQQSDLEFVVASGITKEVSQNKKSSLIFFGKTESSLVHLKINEGTSELNLDKISYDLDCTPR